MGENVIDNRKKALEGYSKIDPSDASNFSGIWNNCSWQEVSLSIYSYWKRCECHRTILLSHLAVVQRDDFHTTDFTCIIQNNCTLFKKYIFIEFL